MINGVGGHPVPTHPVFIMTAIAAQIVSWATMCGFSPLFLALKIASQIFLLRKKFLNSKIAALRDHRPVKDSC